MLELLKQLCYQNIAIIPQNLVFNKKWRNLNKDHSVLSPIFCIRLILKVFGLEATESVPGLV